MHHPLKCHYLMIAWIMAMVLFAPHVALASERGDTSRDAVVYTEVSDVPCRVEERSWYGSKFSFSTFYETSSHRFDGNSVGIEVTSSCPVSGNYYVQLYRGGSYIGRASLKRKGFSRAEWSNVGPGYYKFRFSKSNDGAIVSCSNVAMFSW